MYFNAARAQLTQYDSAFLRPRLGALNIWRKVESQLFEKLTLESLKG